MTDSVAALFLLLYFTTLSAAFAIGFCACLLRRPRLVRRSLRCLACGRYRTEAPHACPK